MSATPHPQPIPAPGCPPPRWAILRDTAPDLLDDLTAAWARIEALTLTVEDTGGHLAQLRWTIEHLGALVEDHITASHPNTDSDSDDEIPGLGPVLRPTDWRNPIQGWWQATTGWWEATTALDATGRPAFEATITFDDHGSHAWHWVLYRSDGPELEYLDLGWTETLNHAQRTVEALARHWRDTPDHMEHHRRLRSIHPSTNLACDQCGTPSLVEDLLQADGCPTGGCDSATFAGFTLDDLHDATNQQDTQ